MRDKLIQSAVLQKLIVIGEAASKLPSDYRDAHPEVEWQEIAGLRNRIVHAYFSVEWPIIWAAATEEAPALRKQIAEILSNQ